MSIFQDGVTNDNEKYVRVPTYIGKNYDNIQEVDGIVIKLEERDYNEYYEKGQIYDQKPAQGEQVPMGTEVRLWVSLGPKPEEKTMEQLVGMELAPAEQFLKNQGYVPLIREENSEEVEAGLIIRTDPQKGEPLQSGQTITVWVSKGPAVIKNYVPNVVGMSLSTALNALDRNGFKNVNYEMVDSNEAQDTVVWQSEERNTKIDVTTQITLHVSKGPAEPPTEPPTDPTEPSEAPTEPTVTNPPAVTKTVTWRMLEGTVEAYPLTVKNKATGAIVLNQMIQPGQDTIQVLLSGTGVQVYELYFNGTWAREETVDFTS